MLEGELDVVTEEGRVRRFRAMWNNMGAGKRGVIKDIYEKHTGGRSFDKDVSADIPGADQLYEWAVSTERDIYSKE